MAKGAYIVLCEYSSLFSILSNCNSESFGWYCTVNKNTNVVDDIGMFLLMTPMLQTLHALATVIE
eukprot:scaffold250_cov192-Alexandrium_tamarense.AAC.10